MRGLQGIGIRGLTDPISCSMCQRDESWWLLGGISASSCIAAYRPFGSTSLSASYTNLANPGTYDAYLGVAPTFDTALGWAFNGTTQYLKTGVIPSSGWSMIVRYSDVVTASRIIIGSRKNNLTASRFRLSGITGASVVEYASGSYIQVSPSLTSGVLGIAGQQGFRNGLSDGAACAAWDDTPGAEIYIGANNGAGTAGLFCQCSIQAVALYNTILTAAQMLAVTNYINDTLLTTGSFVYPSSIEVT